MNKLIISLAFTITLPLSQIAFAQETEITETFPDAEMTELQLNVCNNSEVNSILSSNQPDKTALDDVLVANSTGDYNVLTKSSYDGMAVLSSNTLSPTATTVDKTAIDTTIIVDPADPTPQGELTNACP